MVRETHYIRRNQATNFAPAIRLAERRGTPLNQFVTINFNHTKIGPRQVSAAFSKLRTNYFNPWYRRPGRGKPLPNGPSAFLWVQEAAGGVSTAHWLVHIPDGRIKDFKTRLAQWLERVAGEIDAGAIDVRPAYNPAGARLYMLKGIDPAFATFYDIDHVDQGIAYGKRAGFSLSLGPTSCRENRVYYTQMMADRAAARATA